MKKRLISVFVMLLLPLLVVARQRVIVDTDIDSDVDAKTIAETGAKSIQLHTGGMCHLDAEMTRQGVEGLGVDDVDLAILDVMLPDIDGFTSGRI